MLWTENSFEALLIERFVRKVIVYDDRFKIEFYPIPNADIYVDGRGNISGGSNNSTPSN